MVAQLQRSAGNKAVSDLLHSTGSAPLQRYFFARGVKQRIYDPAYILTYLVNNADELGLPTGQKRQRLIRSFRATARERRGTKFATWLRHWASHLNAEDVLSDAYDYASGGTTYRRWTPALVSERKRQLESAEENEPAPKKRKINPDWEFAEEPEVESEVEEDTSFTLDEDSETETKETEFAFNLPELDVEPPGIARGGEDIRLLVVTWNLEKSGPLKRDMKQRAIVDIVNDYHPTVMVMQEITDAGILFDGIYTGGKQAVPYSLGLNYTNLVSEAEDIETGILAQEQGMEGVEAEKEIPHYPLGTEYGMAEGPTYRSGSYKENYGLLYEQTQVVGAPVPYFVRDDDGSYRLEQVDEGHVEPFSKESNTRREPLVWQIKIRNSKYSLRPQIPVSKKPDPNAAEWAQIGKERRLEATTTRTIYVMVVHTSPSMKIKDEVHDIMEKAAWLRKNGAEDGEAAVMVAGDWYMEKADPQRFADYVTGSEGWTTGAARVGPNDVIGEEGDRPEYGEEKVQFLRTNQPSKGVGQAADHYVISEQFRIGSTEMIPAETRRSSPLTTRQQDRVIDEDRDARGWLERGSDHTPVVIYLTVDAVAKPAPPREKKRRTKPAAPTRASKPRAQARAPKKTRGAAPARARIKKQRKRRKTNY